MQDYQSLFLKWMAFVDMDLAFRKKMLDSFHLEVQKGFDVIAKIGQEEVMQGFSDMNVWQTIADAVILAIAFAVWKGYALYLISHGIDPEKENLLARQTTNELGNTWVLRYEKDQTRSLLAEIDPILSMFLETGDQQELNLLFMQFPLVMDSSYKTVARIETYLHWAAHQGFVFGILEQQLWEKHRHQDLK